MHLMSTRPNRLPVAHVASPIFEVEPLEPRQLLSAAPSVRVPPGRPLSFRGTGGADTIRVGLHEGDATRLDVSINGKVTTVGLDSFGVLLINGGDGNDDIRVDESLGATRSGGAARRGSGRGTGFGRGGAGARGIALLGRCTDAEGRCTCVEGR